MKRALLGKLKILVFVLALVGWLMLVTVPLEYLGRDLSALEQFLKSPTFTWGIRIGLIIMVVVAMEMHEKIHAYMEKHPRFKRGVRAVLYIGVLGWIVGVGSLVF